MIILYNFKICPTLWIVPIFQKLPSLIQKTSKLNTLTRHSTYGNTKKKKTLTGLKTYPQNKRIFRNNKTILITFYVILNADIKSQCTKNWFRILVCHQTRNAIQIVCQLSQNERHNICFFQFLNTSRNVGRSISQNSFRYSVGFHYSRGRLRSLTCMCHCFG